MTGDVDLGIDHLTDVEAIGRGGFSVVYAATDTQFDRRVAVKVLSNLVGEADRRRFERECRVMGRLSAHPNVVTVHSAGYTANGSPYLLMELIEGGSLADRLAAEGSMPWPRAIDYITPIAHALGQVHEGGILHRDVKPENILLAGDEPRLTDFGIAYLRDATVGASTQITASWLHTAPETFTNDRDECSDLYSLASTLYTLIAGTAPFWREGEDSLNPLMYRLLNEAPPRLPDERCPHALNQFLQTALAKAPDQRQQTAEVFASELESIQAGQDDPASSPAFAAPIPPQPPAQPQGPTPINEAATVMADSSPGGPPGAGPPPYAGEGGLGDGVPPGGRPGGSGRNWSKILLPVALLIGVVGALFGLLAFFDDDPVGATELVLEPIASVGQDPFTSPVVPGAEGGPGGPVSGPAAAIVDALNPPLGDVPATDFSGVELPPKPAPGAIINVAGSAPGLYGGTNVIDVCDRQLLTDFLTADEAKGQAWAEVHGIEPAAIPGFIAGLTDVILQVDTRVTNHGFRNGSATALDSVLQAGTAVLVDEFGMPRVRCYCGNPLLPARGLGSEVEVSGTSWIGFDLDDAIVVSPVDEVDQLVIDDVAGDGFLARTPGDDASEAEPIQSETTPTTPPITAAPTTASEPTATSEATTTSEPRATRPVSEQITAAGSASASSTFGGNEYPPGLSVDGNAASSWFSAGGGSATYIWDLGRGSAFIDSISVVGNAAHPEFPTDFGFGSVIVRVLDGGTEVYSQSFSLTGTPDPDIIAIPGVAGNQIVLDFSEGENTICGGFAELIVLGYLL